MELSLLETIRYALAVLRRRWHLFALSVVVISAVSLAIAVLLPPVYVSSARILVESQQIPEEFVRSSVTSAADERIQVIQQRVMTRSNLLTIARKFNMLNDELEGYSSTQIVEYMRGRLSISRYALEKGKRSRGGAVTIAFTVSFENKSPQRAAAITNELVTLILAEDARTRRERASDTSKFLADEAKRLEKNLTDLESQIAAYKMENEAALPERLAFQLAELSNLRQKMALLQSEHRKAREDIKIARLKVEGSLAGQVSSGGQVVDPVQAQLQKMKNELTQAKAVYSASHPKRKLLESRIAVLEKQIEADAEKTANALSEAQDEAETKPENKGAEERKPDFQTTATLQILQDRISQFDAEKAKLQTQIDGLNAIIAKTPQVELGLTTLSRRLEINKAKLEDMWRKYADAQLGERLEDNQKGERFEVIEQPTVPTEPERPNRLMVLGIGIFMAFGVGGAGLVLPEMLDPSIRSVAQLTAGLGIRPLVVIPFFVTPEEKRKRRWRRIAIAFVAVILFVAAVVAVHLLYMPIDLLVQKVLLRFQILI